jgi:cobalt-zinc-cadmium efflux system membrane fusion protein
MLLASCGRAAPAPAAPPAAQVAGAVPEAALATLTLTSEAQQRLGIETAPAEQRAIARTRSLGGEVLPAGGAQTTVAAPLAGTLGAETALPAVGSQVVKGQVILTITPLAPAERDVRIEAERTVAEAVGRQQMAAKRAERTRQLARDGSGSQRAAEEAQADLAVADATLEAARAPRPRRPRGERVRGDPAGGAARRRAAHPVRDSRPDGERRRAALRPGQD